MASRSSTSVLLLSCMISCVFMLLVINVPKAEGDSQLPVCGNKEGCGGIWCRDERRPGKGKCITWTCDLQEDCKKFVNCEGLPMPYCMEGLCAC
ncbi:unnamed protein product [Eruca vesicaria subsp. sativa]|uniref:Uncharacterized protein n=1 Tax=Eruca vesicaria subsp. sativa TaxID=29727 RepID=A0ABC8LVZ6_ERUVS|nr:unnamed protein product [Eruca vesicaria subsp. sativa]